MSRALPGTGNPPSPSPELAAAIEAARAAGSVILGHLGSSQFELKDDRSLVTTADKESEALVRAILGARTPGVPVLGEESATREDIESLPKTEAAWVVDPIDGTASFTAGLPTFGVSIGLLARGDPVLGVFYQPWTDELYACDRTGPAHYGSRPARRVLTPETVDERAFLCATSEAHRDHEIRFPGKVRSLGSTALHVALVARAAAVGALVQPAVWDVAAVTAILRRSGGNMFDHATGAPLDFPGWVGGGAERRDLLACAPESAAILRKFVVARR